MFATLIDAILTAYVIRGFVFIHRYVKHLSLICHTQTLYPRYSYIS